MGPQFVGPGIPGTGDVLLDELEVPDADPPDPDELILEVELEVALDIEDDELDGNAVLLELELPDELLDEDDIIV